MSAGRWGPHWELTALPQTSELVSKGAASRQEENEGKGKVRGGEREGRGKGEVGE